MKDLDEIKLPLGSDNEDLETLSRQKLVLLFDVTKFIVKDEIIDNGIDYRVELKKDKKKLGFGFNIQLKGTGQIQKNNDGSYSKPIYTSNIQYLIDNAQPGYYILYVKDEDCFYYENLTEFAAGLLKKGENWQDQNQHTLRFSKKLDLEAVNGIYETALSHGENLRKIQFNQIQNIAYPDSDDNLIFTSNNQVYSDSEISEAMERYGFLLLNEGRWNDIVELHKKATGNIVTSGSYNLIVGAAYYHLGNYYTALSFLKTAEKLKSDLPKELISHLEYNILVIRLSLAIITWEEYNAKMEELSNSGLIGLYIRLDKATDRYMASLSDRMNAYKVIVKEFGEIINHPDADENLKLTARSELSLINGELLNMIYVRSISNINYLEQLTGADEEQRVQSAQDISEGFNGWLNEIKTIQEDALKHQIYNAFFHAEVNRIKVLYTFEAYTTKVHINGAPIVENNSTMSDLLLDLEKALEFYQSTGFAKNVLWVLTLKYEMLHFMGDFDEANNVMSQLEKLAIDSCFEQEIKKIEALKNEGTTHEVFNVFVDNIFRKAEERKRKLEDEFNSLVKEMEQMDEVERGIIKTVNNDNYHITLFPIGDFQFPRDKMDKVLEILKVSDLHVRDQFSSMCASGILPIANILHAEVKVEGYVNGKLDDKGIANWYNIYRVRKAFYEEQFYRVEFEN